MLFWFRRIQEAAFLSAGHFQRAMFDLIEVERRSEGYGSVISRLRCAASHCKTAIERAGAASLTVELTVLQNAINEVLGKLEKDNGTVYLEVSHSRFSTKVCEKIINNLRHTWL